MPARGRAPDELLPRCRRVDDGALLWRESDLRVVDAAEVADKIRGIVVEVVGGLCHFCCHVEARSHAKSETERNVEEAVEAVFVEL